MKFFMVTPFFLLNNEVSSDILYIYIFFFTATKICPNQGHYGLIITYKYKHYMTATAADYEKQRFDDTPNNQNLNIHLWKKEDVEKLKFSKNIWENYKIFRAGIKGLRKLYFSNL